MRPEHNELIRYRLERASEALDEARILLDNGHLNTSVNRLYYACFYVVSALLLTEGLSSAKHSGVRSLFDQYWVKKGQVSIEVGRIYRHLFVRRQKADYADLVRFRRDDVYQWQASAKIFVEEIGRLVQERLADERS